MSLPEGAATIVRVEAAFRSAHKTVEAEYQVPLLAHAPMEPQSCVAWLHDGQLETWAGHQSPTVDHILAARAAGLPLDRVKLHTLVSGGSFGRRANAWSDFTVAAVNVAVATTAHDREKSRLLNPAHLEHTHRFYERHGAKTVIFARFLPLLCRARSGEFVRACSALG